MLLTLAQLKEILISNRNPSLWLDDINKVLPVWHIDTPKRVAMFLAQCSYESMDFNVLQENLNYTAEELLKVFPTHFSPASAQLSAHHPEVIASTVYANRMGNGDYSSGDGYKYRGRGIIQITGKANYHSLSESVYQDDRCITNPDILLQPNDALLSACWYWGSRNINFYADKGDVSACTKLINGGENGLRDRITRYGKVFRIIQP